MNRSSRLKNVLNRKQDLWADSETDASLLSDNDNNQLSMSSSDTSSDENCEPSRKSCCLICSILPNLSTINTCQKHLNLLTTPNTPAQVVYMMHPAVNNCSSLHCHCRVKSKHRCRSSSSSSSVSPQRRKKRSMTIESSNSSSQSDLFFSPNLQSGGITNGNQQHRFNHVEARLSPSLPPSSTINTSLNHELLLTPFLQRNSNVIEPTASISNGRNSPDVVELYSDSSCSSPITFDRIVHVKDENELLNDNDHKKETLNMAQATEQMRNNEYSRPIILLKRVCFENYN